MKTLQKIKLQRFEEISENHQMMMKGGDDQVRGSWNPETGCYELDEVECVGSIPASKPAPCTCSTCAYFDKINNPISGDGKVTTPFGEWLWKSLAKHDPCCGWN